MSVPGHSAASADSQMMHFLFLSIIAKGEVAPEKSMDHGGCRLDGGQHPPFVRTSCTSQEESMVEEKEDRHSILQSRTKFKVGATLSGNCIGLATAGGHL